MKDMCVYYIQLRGRVDEAEVNAMSPLQMVWQKLDAEGSHFTAHTDQTGLVGLLRHLHNLGFILLGVQRDQTFEETALSSAGSRRQPL